MIFSEKKKMEPANQVCNHLHKGQNTQMVGQWKTKDFPFGGIHPPTAI